MLNNLFNILNNDIINLKKIYNLVIQKGGGDNLNNYFAIIGVLLFAISYIIYSKFIYWPHAKGIIIDINNSTKEYLIKFNINNNECKRILKNPNKEYKINSEIDIQYNPTTNEINECYEFLYTLNIVIIITGFIFILIYFSYDLFSTSQNDVNNDINNDINNFGNNYENNDINLDYNNIIRSNTDINNLYILRSKSNY
jgi:hypothetical protein